MAFLLHRVIRSGWKFSNQRCFSCYSANKTFSNKCSLQTKLTSELFRNTLFMRQTYGRIINIGHGSSGVVANSILDLFSNVGDRRPVSVGSPETLSGETEIKGGNYQLLTSLCSNDKDQRKLLHDIYDILSPGGEFLLGIEVDTFLSKAVLGGEQIKSENEKIKNMKIRSEILDLCSDAGLQVINADFLDVDHEIENDNEIKEVKSLSQERLEDLLDEYKRLCSGEDSPGGRLIYNTKLLHVHGIKPLPKYSMQDL